MGRVIVGFIAAAFVLAGWRNLPRIDQPAAGAAGILLGGAVLAAFWLGRRSVRAEAVATAIATARADAAAAAHAGAQAHSQVIVNVAGDRPADGARSVAEDLYGHPEWIGPARVDIAQLDGSDAIESMSDELHAQVLEEGTG